MVSGSDDHRALGEAEGLIKLFEEVRSELENTRTLNALAGKPWWTSTEAKRVMAKLPPSTAITVPVDLLRISKANKVSAIAALIRASLAEREELCLWLQSWLHSQTHLGFDIVHSSISGDVALALCPESGCFFTVEPMRFLIGIIEGEVQLDWKATLDWREKVLSEPLFSGL